jgi:8-oxo-dGTP pyrophosphatase MutT (NUDIX family)
VILLRERDHDIEVLLLRRHADMKFLGGTWVFPGGGLSPHDCKPPAMSRLLASSDHDLKDVQLAAVPSDLVQGLLIAACRETFEETGVLLAQFADGTPCDAALVERLQAERAGIDADAGAFARMLEREQLYLNAAKLVYWSHWITPSSTRPTRYDTRFFALALPEAQNVSALSSESTEAAWLTPRAVQEAAKRRDMNVPAPTMRNIEDVQACYEQYGSVAALLAAESGRLVLPILPKAVETEQGKIVLMPWDADYHTTPGEGTPPDMEFPPAWRAMQSRRRQF